MFYARFDSHAFQQERNQVATALKEEGSVPTSGRGIVISEHAVRRALKRVNPHKAAGPDKVAPRVLKRCADQLYKILCNIFNLSLVQCEVPGVWKASCIVPVQKKKTVTGMNDLRPVALTSCVMKVFERVFLPILQEQVSDFMDPLQFAYKKDRSVEDAILHVLNNAYSHLDKPNTSIRFMFYDFSSAFNTIQPHILADKLMHMEVDASAVLWVLDYLLNRPQYVKLGVDTYSNVILTNTGAPQGTVLSPFLFSVYTADCRSSHTNCLIDKYADDTVLTGLITDNDDTHYRLEIDRFIQWCGRHYLKLNTGKTREMIVDFRRKSDRPEPVVIEGEPIETVSTYKYLGVLFDNRLDWKQNTDALLKKAGTRLFCLRRLRSFDVNQQLLQMFYSTVLSSVLTFGLSSWGGNISRRDREAIDKIIKKAGGVVGRTQDGFDILYHRRTTNKLNSIMSDASHPMRKEFDGRIIQRSGRMRVPRARTARYANSFVPRAVGLFNVQGGRS